MASRQRMAELAKQAAKLALIEALVPGGTLVVLTILLAGGPLSRLAETRAGWLRHSLWSRAPRHYIHVHSHCSREAGRMG